MKTILIALAVWVVVDVLFLVWWARLSRPDPTLDSVDSTEAFDTLPAASGERRDLAAGDTCHRGRARRGGLLARALRLESRSNSSPSWLKGPRRRGVPFRMLKPGWINRLRNRPVEDHGSDG
ncbi:MAG: hypothetical protein O7I93_08905 [Gemmatimonadetes bacterium]|nr:hypothetical protein [Gemmatimonadota bacterium]